MKQKIFLLFLTYSAIILFNCAAEAQKIKKQTKITAAKTSVSLAASDNTLPHKKDDQTAVSPVYKIGSKNCRNRDSQASEGDDFYRECTAYGEYLLRVSGSDYRVNYGIVAKKSQSNFMVMLFPLGEGAAAKYERADLYDQKLAEEIEWRLDKQGKPFAIVVRAAFYKNTGSAKTFNNPKNKVAEFYFVRGLIGFENLKEDVPAVGTAFNPLEQARATAAEYYENHRQ